MHQINLLTADLYELALKLAVDVFLRGSVLHKIAGLEKDSYLNCLRPAFVENAKQNMSVVALDEQGNVIGCVIACDFTKQGAVLSHKNLRPMQALFSELETQYLKHRPVSHGTSVLIDMACVHPDHLKGGIYTRMRNAVHDLARQQGFTYVIGELSSVATQRLVVEKMGHKVIVSVAFSDFQFEGLTPFQTIHNPKAIVLTEGLLR